MNEFNNFNTFTGDNTQETVQETNSGVIVKRKKKSFLSFAAALIAVAMVGSASGFLTVHFAGDDLPFINQLKTNNEGIRLPDSTTPLSDNSSSPVSEFLVNDKLAEINTSTEYSYSELYEIVKESVVAIKIYYTYRSWNGNQEQSGVVGSGVIFTTDGYILTNHHVIGEADKVSVIINLTDEENGAVEYEAEVIGSDKETDLAVLKIKGDAPFKVVPIGDSSSLKIGQEVAAIGYPLGLDRTMTSGIVSGLNRAVDQSGGYELSCVQVTAAVNPGNSGGPLFDMYGNVVGIVNKKLVFETVENIGFAISINEAKPIINELIENGTVSSRPVLGITGQALNEQTAALYDFTNVTNGLLVQSITPTAPAAKSGLAIGDIIIKINGRNVTGVGDIQAETKNLKVGDTVVVTVLRWDQFRNSTEIEITIELTKS